MRRWWPVLFLALIPLIPLWRAVFAGEAIGAFDQIRQMVPWNATAPERPWDVLQADSVLQFYPWRDMVFEAWGKGELPLWNPYVLAGTPLLANSQSAGFYPPHILMGVLHVPTPTAMTLLAWFHLFWAGLGVFVLCRRLGASEVGAAIGGSSFALSAFMVAWTALPSVISTVSWIPWCLAAVTSLSGTYSTPLPPSSFTSQNEKGERRRIPRAGPSLVALALCVAMMFLAGHLQFAAYGCMAIAVVAIGLAFSSARRWAGLALTVLGLGLGGMLAAPQLLPVLKYSEFSHRRNAPTAEGYQAYVGGAIKPFELATLVSPLTLGDPTVRAGIEGLEEVSEYWPPFIKQGANFAEAAVWIGPLVLGLLMLVPWRERRVWPVAILGGLTLLLALGTVLNWPLYFYAPGWSSTGSPGRIIVLFVMAASILAALGWTRLGEASRKQLFLAIGVPAGAGLLLHFVGGALAPAPQLGLEPFASTLQAVSQIGAVPILLVLALLGAGALFLGHALGAAKYRGFAIAVPVLLAAIGFATTYVPTGKAPQSLPEGSVPSGRIAVANDFWGIIVRAKAILPPNSSAWLHQGQRVREIGGYDSLLHRDTKALLDDINGEDSAPPANGNMIFIKEHHKQSKLSDAGVTEIWSQEQILGLEQLGPYRYKLAGKGRAYTSSGTATIKEESYQHLVVGAEGPGKLIVKDRMMDGWSARVDGKIAQLPAGLWREVDLPEGSHTVEFRYTPPGMATGLWLCLIAMVVCVAVGVGSGAMRSLAKDVAEASAETAE